MNMLSHWQLLRPTPRCLLAVLLDVETPRRLNMRRGESEKSTRPKTPSEGNSDTSLMNNDEPEHQFLH